MFNKGSQPRFSVETTAQPVFRKRELSVLSGYPSAEYPASSCFSGLLPEAVCHGWM